MNYKLFYLVLLVLILPACSILKPVPNTYSMTISTGPQLNPDTEGRSSPVVLRIYQLTNESQFKEKEFFDIFDDEKTALADTFITKQELLLNPNESRKINLEVSEKTQIVGLLAAFRNLDNARWRETVNLKKPTSSGIPLHGDVVIKVHLDNTSIDLTIN